MKADEAAIALFGLICDPNVRNDRAEVRDHDFWDAIVAAARRHGLAPLLYWRLTEPHAADLAVAPQPAALPADTRDTLRNAYLFSLAANLRAGLQLAEVTGAMNARGISPILLKGAHLAFGVYPDPGLRPMCDLDLLVERAAVPAAAQVLAELECRPVHPYDLESEMTLLHHLPAYGKAGCHFIEIHWALLRPEERYLIDTAGLWVRARPGGIPNIPARVLAPPDILLHLCLHAAAADRLADGLKRLVDVVEIVRSMRDEQALIEARTRAAAWGASRCLSLVLSLCADLAPGSLPPDVLQTLNPEPVTGATLEMARSLLLSPPGNPRQISSNLARAIEYSSGSALREIGRGFFPSRTFLATIYGVSPRSAAIWPCYPRRWVDLLRRYVPPGLRAIVGERLAANMASRQSNENALAEWLAGGRQEPNAET